MAIGHLLLLLDTWEMIPDAWVAIELFGACADSIACDIFNTFALEICFQSMLFQILSILIVISKN